MQHNFSPENVVNECKTQSYPLHPEFRTTKGYRPSVFEVLSNVTSTYA